MFIKRIMGLIITVISAIGLILGIVGAIMVPGLIEQAKGATGEVLAQVAGSSSSAEETIITIRNTIQEVSNGLETAEISTIDIALAITSTETVLDEVTVVMGDNVPTSIETVQEALPNLITVAKTVDQALLQLSKFGIDESLGGIPIPLPSFELLGREIELPSIQLPALPLNFNLGIEYDPANAFDESLVGIEEQLEGIPESMRSLSSGLEETTVNMIRVGEDVSAISENIASINEEVSKLPGQIDDYLATLDGVKDNLISAETTINAQLDTAKLVLIGVLLWLALLQIAPLYIGYHLLTGQEIN